MNVLLQNYLELNNITTSDLETFQDVKFIINYYVAKDEMTVQDADEIITDILNVFNGSKEEQEKIIEYNMSLVGRA